MQPARLKTHSKYSAAHLHIFKRKSMNNSLKFIKKRYFCDGKVIKPAKSAEIRKNTKPQTSKGAEKRLSGTWSFEEI